MATASQFKRAVFEWCGMGALAMSLGCFGYWAVSVFSHRVDDAMSFHDLGLDVSASNGVVAVSLKARVSLLIPAVVFGLIAVVCIWCWIRTVRKLARAPQPEVRREL
jgi:hypothetical protein